MFGGQGRCDDWIEGIGGVRWEGRLGRDWSGDPGRGRGKALDLRTDIWGIFILDWYLPLTLHLIRRIPDLLMRNGIFPS